MRESRTYGAVRGAPSNGRPYRDHPILTRLWRDHQDEIEIADGSMVGGVGAGGTCSVAAEAARRIEVGEFAEIELDYGLQGLAGGGVAQRFR
jgi:hypothetical protein